MAGDWIKFEISTPDKPEVWQMADELKIDPDAVVGKLLRVWSWFDQQSEKGNAPTVTKMLLNRLVGVTGFCESMISCGWLTEENGKIFVTSFEKHNGKSAKTRANTAKRVSNFKNKSEKSNAEGNAGNVTGALPKEEKRREDISTTTVVEIHVESEPKKVNPDIEKIFDHWKSRMNHPGAKLDAKRDKAIKSAIKLGYSIADLIAAIDGCGKDPWSMGKHERNTTVYDSLGLIFRDAEHIDKFIKINRLPAAPASDQRKFDPLAYVNRHRAQNDVLGGLNGMDISADVEQCEKLIGVTHEQ